MNKINNNLTSIIIIIITILIINILSIKHSLAIRNNINTPNLTLITKIQQRYQQINNLVANYKRKSIFTASNHDIERTILSYGYLKWKRPISLKLEQNTPHQETIITNSNQVWWIRPERGRADIYPIEQFTIGLRSFIDILEGLSQIDKNFIIEKLSSINEELEIEELETIILHPKEERADIKRLILWFDEKTLLLKGFRIVSHIGDITEYRFSQIEVNPSLESDNFIYQPPIDYKVIDHRTYTTSKNLQ